MDTFWSMAAKKMNALEFARRYLRKSPKAPFAKIQAAAKKKKIVLWPISYGRALALEGLVKSKPKKAKKKTGKKRGRPVGSKNKPKRGRPKGSKNKRKGFPCKSDGTYYGLVAQRECSIFAR